MFESCLRNFSRFNALKPSALSRLKENHPDTMQTHGLASFRVLIIFVYFQHHIQPTLTITHMQRTLEALASQSHTHAEQETPLSVISCSNGFRSYVP